MNLLTVFLSFITAHITKHISLGTAVPVLLINRGPVQGYPRGSVPADNPGADKLSGELINNRQERGKRLF